MFSNVFGLPYRLASLLIAVCKAVTQEMQCRNVEIHNNPLLQFLITGYLQANNLVKHALLPYTIYYMVYIWYIRQKCRRIYIIFSMHLQYNEKFCNNFYNVQFLLQYLLSALNCVSAIVY